MEYTIDQWRKEAEARFGSYVENYKFICPRCGRVNVGQEFKEAGARTNDTAQCCIGRFAEDKGCDWAAFGLLGTLGRGDVVIFPEHDEPFNNILYDFQDRFIDLARMYHRKTGEELSFVPLYIAPDRREMAFGAPVRFDSAAPAAEERERIKACLMERITDLAAAMPLHTVVPYRNIPKREYPKNLPIVTYRREHAAPEEEAHEETSR